MKREEAEKILEKMEEKFPLKKYPIYITIADPITNLDQKNICEIGYDGSDWYTSTGFVGGHLFMGKNSLLDEMEKIEINPNIKIETYEDAMKKRIEYMNSEKAKEDEMKIQQHMLESMKYNVGDRISHQYFGKGTINKRDVSAGVKFYRVAWDSGKEEWIREDDGINDEDYVYEKNN